MGKSDNFFAYTSGATIPGKKCQRLRVQKLLKLIQPSSCNIIHVHCSMKYWTQKCAVCRIKLLKNNFRIQVHIYFTPTFFLRIIEFSRSILKELSLFSGLWEPYKILNDRILKYFLKLCLASVWNKISSDIYHFLLSKGSLFWGKYSKA